MANACEAGMMGRSQKMGVGGLGEEVLLEGHYTLLCWQGGASTRFKPEEKHWGYRLESLVVEN